jgi:hypothetical protein
MSLEKKNNFNAILVKISIVYCREEGGGLFPNLNCMSVMSSRQVHDPNFVPLSLITYICLTYAHDLLARQHSYHMNIAVNVNM